MDWCGKRVEEGDSSWRRGEEICWVRGFLCWWLCGASVYGWLGCIRFLRKTMHKTTLWAAFTVKSERWGLEGRGAA